MIYMNDKEASYSSKYMDQIKEASMGLLNEFLNDPNCKMKGAAGEFNYPEDPDENLIIFYFECGTGTSPFDCWLRHKPGYHWDRVELTLQGVNHYYPLKEGGYRREPYITVTLRADCNLYIHNPITNAGMFFEAQEAGGPIDGSFETVVSLTLEETNALIRRLYEKH